MHPEFVVEMLKDSLAAWQKQQKKAQWEALRKRLKEAKQKSPHKRAKKHLGVSVLGILGKH